MEAHNQSNSPVRSLARRQFIKTASAILSTVPGMTRSIFATGRERLKVASISCGGRGTGALNDFVKTAEHLHIKTEIIALADYFKPEPATCGL